MTCEAPQPNDDVHECPQYLKHIIDPITAEGGFRGFGVQKAAMGGEAPGTGRKPLDSHVFQRFTWGSPSYARAAASHGGVRWKDDPIPSHGPFAQRISLLGFSLKVESSGSPQCPIQKTCGCWRRIGVGVPFKNASFLLER